MGSHVWDRRSFLRSVAALPWLPKLEANGLPPVRAITRGPKHHWFGYYDKLEFDPTRRYVLGNEVDFEGRHITPNDVLKVGMVDLEDGDRWIELGESLAWCWQKGCMLQWVPGSKTEVIWNDLQDGRLVSHILDVKTRKKRTLPTPIYALSPDGRWAMRPDFCRIYEDNRGYGYMGSAGMKKSLPVPEDSGIWRIDLSTGEETLLFSVADVVAKYPNARPNWDGVTDYPNARHYFYCLLFAPDGKRFTFLDCWGPDGGRFWQRMFTANTDGKEMCLLSPGDFSHFWWRDPQHILAWGWHPSHGDKFYLYEDKTDKAEVIGLNALTEDGHCTVLPDKRWMLNDTYPDKDRIQHPHLFNLETGIRYPLGHFYSPPEYKGQWRCDNHPRFSPDGRKVVIDSAHGGNGRQMYLIDISQIV